MRRRDFLVTIPMAGVGLGNRALLFSGLENSYSADDGLKDKKILDKVKLAMLSMQRATWEQGVAMQAFLESGESDLVILMAKDAV
ncbi:MAG: glycosyl hydrolase, partial [Bacteroidota bacterium]